MRSTDDQLIRQLRDFQRYRRPLGVAFLLIGFIATAVLLYYVHNLRVRSAALFAEVRPSVTPTTQQAAEVYNAARYNIGFALGTAFGGGVAAGSSLAMHGLFLLLPNHKDRLLLQCWRGESD